MHIDFKLWYNADDLNLDVILDDDDDDKANDIEAYLGTTSSSPSPRLLVDWVWDGV